MNTTQDCSFCDSILDWKITKIVPWIQAQPACYSIKAKCKLNSAFENLGRRLETVYWPVLGLMVALSFATQVAGQPSGGPGDSGCSMTSPDGAYILVPCKMTTTVIVPVLS